MSLPIYFSITSHEALTKLISQISNSDPKDPDRLYLDYPHINTDFFTYTFSQEDLDDLLNLLDNPAIHLARLQITLDIELFKTEKFKTLIKKLNPDVLHYLELNFMPGPSQEQVNAALKESGIADVAFYPVNISHPFDKKLDKTFIQKIINNVRHHSQKPKKASLLKATDDDSNLPRIKLKELITNQKLREDDNLVSIDVSHEAQTQLITQINEEVEVTLETQISTYTGPIYNYALFMQRLYGEDNLLCWSLRYNQHHFSMKNIQQELFAPLPCAIQFITPAAAKKMYYDYAQYLSFNKDNLPPGMFLQKTPLGALVLDYDLGYERNYNEFTPRNNLRYEEEEGPYFVPWVYRLYPDDFEECVKWPFYRKNLPYLNQEHFTNLYVRHGVAKVIDFLKLFEIENPDQNEALADCLNQLFESYVSSYKQCEFMVKGTWFEECINRIKQESDTAKLACFTSLIKASKYTRHDLQHTLDSFDIFWEKIKKICPEDQLNNILFTASGDLREKAGIPPVVAMERLLTILQNARDVKSQIEYLKDLPPGAFRAYYASAYEGLSMIHKDMDITWAPNVLNLQYLEEWPSNLDYFRNTFVLLKDDFFYINQDSQKIPLTYTDQIVNGKNLFIEYGKDILKRLKQEKKIQLSQESLLFLTRFKPDPIPFNQHAKVYQIDLSTLHKMALEEPVIYYPKFYAYLHRYMGQQKTGISYADFRAQTQNCDFLNKDKVLAFTLLFFIKDENYDAQLGLAPLIAKLKQLNPDILNKLAEILYTLDGRGVELNNQEGLIILNELLSKNPDQVLEGLKNRKLIITEYDDLLNKYKNIALSIKNAIRASHININQVPILLNTLQSFSEEHQKELFKALQTELNDNLQLLCQRITDLRVAALPPEYIIHYIRLKELSSNGLIKRFNQDHEDPILAYILSSSFKGNSHDAQKLLDLTEDSQHKHKIVALLKSQNLLQLINDPLSLEILAKSYATLLPNQQFSTAQAQELCQLLAASKNEDLIELYKIASPSSICLLDALKNNRLDSLEREPFGPRDDAKLFDCSQVERVVNESRDWSNNTVYSYRYRRQLMEAFTLVDAIGYKLPIFEGKTVKDLSNKQIQDYFLNLKNKSVFQDLSHFEQKLIALSLIREALYRSTGQMPYSTQMIAIIDCLMHPEHVISNIDTGQGKSLIDMAKAALLWTDSDRVDITTSSIPDAQRDLENFGPFLSFLKIPHGNKPITTSSEYSDFVANGINISTFAQLSLFEAKMKMEGKILGKKTDVVSLIINESDYSLLEDRTIYRYATSNVEGLGLQAEWIYTAINEFVLQPQFTSNTTSAERDILNLKDYLRLYAKEHAKKTDILSGITKEQYLKWIEAAILVQYKLKENVDYIIPEEQQAVTIRGHQQMSHVVKLLMSEGKVKTRVSEDAKFGNAVQQLLYAKLNVEYPNRKFFIEPESKTILSSNNRNLIESYLNRVNPGLIWGSSGTVGSVEERKELHAKYNIAFSKIAPHQAKRVEMHEPIYYKDQNAQFEAINNKMSHLKLDPKARPQLIFCKDINSALKLHALMAKTHPNNVQVFTGGDNERTCVARAGLGGMITISTAALGRNTDILYNRGIGMNVMHTCINSYNLEDQLTGRGGREGSEGDIDFYFNEQELAGKTKKQIQDQICAKSKRDRDFNEEIYTILGNTLAQLEQKILRPSLVEFLDNTWSQFSNKYENLYRELTINKQYDKEAFVDKIVTELKAYNLNKQAILNAIQHQFSAHAAYNPYTAPVKLQDCTPPVELAYTLVNKKKPEKPLDAAARKEIKDKVNELLKNYTRSKESQFHADYINYLNKTEGCQNEIRAIHQECIKEFLETNSKTSLPWYKRLFSYQSQLNKITNSAHYLILFKSLLSVPGSTQDKKVELDIAKNTTIALIKEYNKQWFIHKEHKKLSNDLLKDLNEVNDLAGMIKLLDNYQIKVAQKDTEINKSRKWFLLHRMGSSRLQNTISSALNLTSALHDQPTDNYKALLDEVNKTDANNKAVLKTQIKTAINVREHANFFANSGKQNKASKEPDLSLDNALLNL